MQIFETFECSGQNSSNCRVNFETTCQLLFKFCIILHFLLWIKGSHQILSLETFKCSGKNLPNSSCHFLNHKSVFLQILDHSSLSRNITPLYFFGSNIIYFFKRSPLKCTFLRLLSARVKIRQISYANFETTSQFLSKFRIIFHCHDI